MPFFSNAEWLSMDKYDGMNLLLKWLEVPTGIIFHLNSIEKKEKYKFETYILHFTDDEGLAYQAYAPSHFIKQIRKNRTKNQRPYFVSHGVVSRGETRMASFEICYKTENKVFPLFDV